MKIGASSASFLIAITALAIGGLALGQNKRVPPVPSPAKVTVLNPAVASKMAERLSLSPRLDTVEGKVVYMVDINWGGSETAYSVFEEMQAWFNQNMPGVRSVIRIKKGGYDADDPSLWKEVAQNGNAAIIGVSG